MHEVEDGTGLSLKPAPNGTLIEAWEVIVEGKSYKSPNPIRMVKAVG